MNAESGSGSSGTFIWGVIAGIAVLVGAGGYYLFGTPQEEPEDNVPPTEVAVPSTEDSTDSSDSASSEATDEAAPTDTASDQAEESAPSAPAEDSEDTAETSSQPMPPVLDQIFVEPDGNAVLSGNAEPGTDVRVLLDGELVHSFTVDDSGQFAEFVLIPFSESARGLTLETGGDQPLQSDDYVIAALPAPEPVAEAAPEVAAADSDATEPAVADAETAQQDEAEAPAPEVETADATPQTSQAEDQQVADASNDKTAQDAQVADATNQEAAQDIEDQQIAILRSGEDGVELVQSPTVQPQAPEQVAIDTIGYSNSGDVQLTGRVPDGSVVRLYLDNRLVADLAPADDGKWRSELEGIDPGVYTLRVDEVAADGTVVSRLETPFKREPVEVLRAADAATTSGDEPEASTIRSVTVQKGDTLWAISRDRFGEGILYVRLFEANRDSIRDPDLIYPGQIFTIPE